MTRDEANERCDHWMTRAREAVERGEQCRREGDNEMAYAHSLVAEACTNLASRYLEAARA